MNKKFRWDVTYVYWGITAFCVIAGGAAVYLIMDRWPSVSTALVGILRVFSPIIYGLMFAYLLNKIMMFFENRVVAKTFHRIMRMAHGNERIRQGTGIIAKTLRRAIRVPKPLKKQLLPRYVSVLLTVLSTLFLIGGLFTLVLPQLFFSLETLVTSVPSYLNTIINWVQGYSDLNPILEDAAVNYAAALIESATEWIQDTVLAQAETVVTSIVAGALNVVMTITNLLIGLVLSVFLLFHKEVFLAQAKKVIYGFLGPRRGNKLIAGVSFLDRSCGSFITARLIDALIIGVLCYIFMVIARMPYAMLIAVIVGVTNIIPFFGPFIGAIPSALLILLVNPTQCLIFVIFIIVLQQLDGNVIYPRIQGTTLGLSGFWIVVSLLVFNGFFGFWGMLLGVPVFTVIYASFRGLASRKLQNRGLPTETDRYKEIHCFDAETNEPVLKSSLPPVVSERKKRFAERRAEKRAKGRSVN